MSDPSKRSFVTEHGKEMNLYPQELFFLGGSNGTVKLKDETGITFSTDKKIRIIAKQSVLVNGKILAVSAPAGELALVKGNILSGETETTMVQSYRFDLLAARRTKAEGWRHQTFKAHDDAPQEGSFDWGGLIGNVLAGIAVAAVVGLAVASSILFLPATIALISGTAIASGTMIAAGIIGGVATAAGTIATVGKAIDDVQSGQVSDRKTYINTSYNAAATTGAVLQMLYGSYHLAKFLSQSPQIITNLAKFLSSAGNSGGSLTPAFATAEISGGMGSVGGTAALEIGAILIGENVGSLVAGLGSTVAGIMMFAR